jgi:hypothetical protein
MTLPVATRQEISWERYWNISPAKKSGLEWNIPGQG